MARIKRKSFFFSSLVTVFNCLLFSTTHGQQVGTNCANPRVRRSWEMYNATEKSLYLEAIGVAMDKGFHQKFIQIHTEYLSEKEAHGNCMFIYWHRIMLLGYENMLRSLDPKFQCLTLPYWDHVSARARRSTGTCTNLLSCSPFLADSSGDMAGTSKNLIIYNVSIPVTSSPSSSATTCMNRFPLSQFCGNNTGCAKCITRKTRTAMSSTAYPDSASFTSVYQQIFSSNNSYTFTTQVERGVHRAKGNDSRWFNSCARRTSGSYSTADNITIRGFANDGKTVVNVWQDPKNMLYPFFKDLPYKYADYVDAKDLGNYSYTYALSGGLATFYEKCWASTQVSATSTTLLADERQHWPRGRDRGNLYPIIEPGTSYDEKVKRWNIALYEAARIVGFEEAAAKEQMEMVMCQYQEDCLGGVVDYTDLFRANFGVQGHPRCYTLLQYLDSGDQVIGIPQWKSITNRFLPCAAYRKKEAPVSDFVKAVSELKKSLERSKSPDDYVAATFF
ncbi:uncharacterized protein PITG_04324 [Phytophthora infestans T30-4]|uniref:Tyrosinase copper-binding domain-containing protein n=1 Tax=Phytophthora infestans (strain T30-4) TaxID=403677 RepID=D0N106_PHYIT|nr:uncharacterized protein PITG_04324 [Phytophthora infestans T30-4]EEY67319.1 conserved hypothetical protein [Phytophthora infestans T30-4]|eukprot:XP_002905967.1 conserved hypothetical protein [Phytophthora infestans T30-4]